MATTLDLRNSPKWVRRAAVYMSCTSLQPHHQPQFDLLHQRLRGQLYPSFVSYGDVKVIFVNRLDEGSIGFPGYRPLSKFTVTTQIKPNVIFSVG